MPKPTALPRPLDKSAFTLGDGESAGLTRDRMRNSSVVTVGRGIRAPKDADLDFAGKVRPYTRINSGSAASHDTAARLWDMPSPKGRDYSPAIHISRGPESARVQRPGVIGHRTVLFPDEVACVSGLFLTTRVRTWLDLAQNLPLDDLVVIADYLVRVPRPEFENRFEPYATPLELGNIIARHPGKKGVRTLREALKLLRIGADSPPETRLRLAMVRAGLPEPRVNERIIDHAGNKLHSPDLSIPQFRIAIEYEGQGHSLPDQVDRDIGRTERTLAAGWIEVRISKRHMANGAKLAMDKIVSALIEQGWKYEDIAC